ncbi:MAG TPA: zf-HC2 domain-containing protein [Bryobacteraceae bacterium]|nr:zf-HC2 domain-containing protein [Bryobacteraceae bacterium]
MNVQDHNLPRHVTDAEIERFCCRELPPAGLIEFTDHIATCEECQGRVLSRSRFAAAQTAMERDFNDLVDHVPELDIHAYVDHRLSSERRREIEGHLKECPECVAEIRDLQAFAAQSRSVSRFRSPKYISFAAAAAAALIAVLGLTLMLGRYDSEQVVALKDARGMVSVDAAGRISGVGNLTSGQIETVRQALLTKRLPPAPSLSELVGTQGALLGNSESTPLRLLAPIGTAVLNDRPTLRWTTVPESKGYTVTIQNQGTGETASSPLLQSAQWTPLRPLVRGQTYVWQVAARTDRGEIVVPRPPNPPAKFLVVDSATASKFERLPASSTVRGVLYASVGLMDDAERELEALSALNPGSEVAAALLKQAQQRR